MISTVARCLLAFWGETQSPTANLSALLVLTKDETTLLQGATTCSKVPALVSRCARSLRAECSTKRP